jgi:hypothetical protein
MSILDIEFTVKDMYDTRTKGEESMHMVTDVVGFTGFLLYGYVFVPTVTAF